jgi:hypothetical protein
MATSTATAAVVSHVPHANSCVLQCLFIVSLH